MKGPSEKHTFIKERKHFKTGVAFGLRILQCGDDLKRTTEQQKDQISRIPRPHTMSQCTLKT